MVLWDGARGGAYLRLSKAFGNFVVGPSSCVIDCHDSNMKLLISYRNEVLVRSSSHAYQGHVKGEEIPTSHVPIQMSREM